VVEAEEEVSESLREAGETCGEVEVEEGPAAVAASSELSEWVAEVGSWCRGLLRLTGGSLSHPSGWRRHWAWCWSPGIAAGGGAVPASQHPLHAL
jgi:hypothetical protein